MSNFKARLEQVKAFVFDVDGVFTDGSIYLHPDKEWGRSMNIKDGYALNYTMKLNKYVVCIITGGTSTEVKSRFEKLGVQDIYMSSHDKLKDYEAFKSKHGLKDEEVLYMGDDIPDLPVMKKVGFPTCPLDAVEEIKEAAVYISDKPGGRGCVRDILEQVLKVQNNWLV